MKSMDVLRFKGRALRRGSLNVLMAVCLLAGWEVLPCLAVSSINVPLGHWSYEALDKLDAFGLLQSQIHGTKPFTRTEFARLVNEAERNKGLQNLELPSFTEEMLRRLKDEYKDELKPYTETGEQPASTFIKPVDEVEARYVYLDGRPRSFKPYPEANPRVGIDGTEGTPLVYNNNGVNYGQHHNFTLQFSTSMRLGDILTGYVEPILLLRENDGGLSNVGDEVKVDILRGYGKIAPWNIELEAGRDSLWWGQGYHGDLVMTNNAEPFNLVKLSNPNPSILPWYLKYLGPFKYTFFVARLEEDREAPHALLGGMRFNFKPSPYFEMGLGAGFIFNGDGRPRLTFEDFLDIIGFQGGESNRKFNQVAALDFRFELPFLWNAQLYGEYGGEDSGGTEYPEEIILGDVGFMVGAYFPRLDCDGRLDLRVEYANNAHRKDSTPGFWYGNSVYTTGYTYRGMIIGHHMAGDAFDLFARSTYNVTNDLKIGLDYDFMSRGETLSPVEEQINQVGVDVNYRFNERYNLSARYGYERVDNFDLEEGVDHSNHMAMTVLQVSF